MAEYHVPVMLQECLEGLAIDKDGVYVDCTFGGGGHSRAIAERLENGRLLAFDQDPDAEANAQGIRSLTLIAANFRHLKKYLRLHGANKVDGILADLGVSSHQFDTAERGFSYRFDAPLDMRMDKNQANSAADIVNTYSEAELKKILSIYGELPNAGKAASLIFRHRVNKKIETTGELLEVLRPLAPRSKEKQYFSMAFQALRIEVNDEMKVLEEMLVQSAEVIKPGGRLVIMSYHSLEDRLVKNFMKKGKFEGEVEKDVYGNENKPFKVLSAKATVPSEEEIEANPRARSAKLRVAERI
ncbi:MAG: 16S rRNA (cytosine(1402)-N(4))-methyltransferase RsmH [Cytophagales bacterium]|nr:16S rRNA (cytosine(1402)-N(4))-methyltransferase RsmH [Cytophagales bacterium]